MPPGLPGLVGSRRTSGRRLPQTARSPTLRPAGKLVGAVPLLHPFRHPLVAAVLETAAGLLYPPACAGCEAALEPGQYLCAACDESAPRLEPPFCAMCSQTFGQSVNGDPAGLLALAGPLSCPYCREHPPRFDCAVSARRHDGFARDLIARFKYQGQHYLCRPLAGWLAAALRDDARLRDWQTDGTGLVPVPLHLRRRRERGFNQAESLCRALSRETGLPVWNALRRVRYTRTQTQLTRAERQQNLRGAIEPARRFADRLPGARVILVDDVFTTGSTVNECARVLSRAGAASVRVLTVARR